MDPKGKGMVINDKEKESFVNEPNDDKPTDSDSGHKRKDGRAFHNARTSLCSITHFSFSANPKHCLVEGKLRHKTVSCS